MKRVPGAAIVMAAIITAACSLPTGPAGAAGNTGPQGQAGMDGTVRLIVVPSEYPVNDLAFSPTTLVSVADGGQIWVSADAKNWVQPSSLPNDLSQNLNSIVFGNGVFVAVGNEGTIVRGTTSGDSWSSAQSGLAQDDYLIDVTFGNGVFVAVCLNKIIISADGGITWIDETPSEASGFWSVSFTNGRFFTGTDASILYTSTDGINWSEPISVPGFEDESGVVSVAFGNGVYLVVDDLGNMASSTDGYEWAKMFSLVKSGTGVVTSLSFGYDRFVVLRGINPSELFWLYDDVAWLHPSTSLPEAIEVPEAIYTSVHWVPWLRGGVYIITQAVLPEPV